MAIGVEPADPDRIFAIVNYKLFRSDDRGKNWQALAVDAALALAFAADGAIFVGGPETSYRSTDSGRTWQALAGLQGRFVLALAVDPLASDGVYAMTSVGLLKSVDGGSTWRPTGDDLPLPSGPLAGALIADAIEPGTLYARTADRVFKSTDAGATWRQSSSGLPTDCGLEYRLADDPTHRLCVLTLAADEASPSTLYVGTDGRGIYRSIDGAETWTPLGGTIGARAVGAIAVDPSGSGRLYTAVADAFDPYTHEPLAPRVGSVFRSDDGGGFWREVAGGLPPAAIAPLSIDPQNPDVVYAGTDGAGVFTSSDGGGNWQAAERGPSSACLIAIAAVPATPTRLLLSTIDEASPRLLFSENRGGEWSDSGRTGPAPVDELVVDPNDPQAVYGVTFDAQVLKSTDGGRTWARRDPSPIRIFDIAIDPGSPAVFYAACGSCGVAKSVDGALTWQQMGSGLGFISGVAVDAGSGAIYATAEGVAYRSSDGGESWVEVAPVPDSLSAELTVASGAPPTLFATTSEGIYASRDQAASWEKVDLPAAIVPGLFHVAVSPSNPNTVYALANGQLFRSDDGGIDWTPVAAPLRRVNDLAVDPNDARTVYAATCSDGGFELRQDTPSSGGDGCAVAPPGSGPAVHVLAMMLLAMTVRRSRSRLAR